MMKNTVYEIYELFVEIKKAGTNGRPDAAAALENAALDDVKPTTVFGTAAEAEDYIKTKQGSIDDFGTYWRVHGWISYEVDRQLEDGEVIDSDYIGVSALSDFDE